MRNGSCPANVVARVACARTLVALAVAASNLAQGRRKASLPMSLAWFHRFRGWSWVRRASSAIRLSRAPRRAVAPSSCCRPSLAIASPPSARELTVGIRNHGGRLRSGPGRSPF